MIGAKSPNGRNARRYLLPSCNKRIFRVDLPAQDTAEGWKTQIDFLRIAVRRGRSVPVGSLQHLGGQPGKDEEDRDQSPSDAGFGASKRLVRMFDGLIDNPVR